jgi:tetratricopeptide (TPR) repeat protein
MLVSVQEYAAEKRRALGVSDEAESRHRAWFARSGTPEAIDSLYVHGGVARNLALVRELENLVAACDRAVTRGEGAGAVALLESASAVLQNRGPFAVRVALAERVLGVPSLSEQERASATVVLGIALHQVGRADEGRTRLDGALALAREVKDRRCEGIVLNQLGHLHYEHGRMDEARAHYDAALAVVREVGDRRREGIVLDGLGDLLSDQGQLDECAPHYHAALAVARDVGDRRSEGIVLGNLGMLHWDRSQMDDARAHFAAALEANREVGNRQAEAVQLGNLGNVHRLQGRMHEARAHYDASLALIRAVGHRRFEGYANGHLGQLLRLLGEHDMAMRHLAEALAIHREVGFTMGTPHWICELALIEAHGGRRDAALQLAEEAVAVAAPYPMVQLWSLHTLARVRLDRGELPAARDAISRARSLTQPRVVELAAVDALVAVAEGDRAAAEAALAEATADPGLCLPGSEVAQLVAQARRGLESLDVAIAREEPGGP